MLLYLLLRIRRETAGRREEEPRKAAASEGRGPRTLALSVAFSPSAATASSTAFHYVTHGQFFPRRARTSLSGSSRPPARRSATSTLFVVIHREKGRPRRSEWRPRATATAWMAWQLFCSATGSKEGSLQTLLAGASNSNLRVQLSKEQTRPGCICMQTKSMMDKKWSSIQSFIKLHTGRQNQFSERQRVAAAAYESEG
jgi:hypothetical protein